MTGQLDRLKHALADRHAIEREIGSGGMATVHDPKGGVEPVRVHASWQLVCTAIELSKRLRCAVRCDRRWR